MIDRLATLIVDESKWLTISLSLALTTVAFLLWRLRRPARPTRQRVAMALHLCFGLTIGTMAFGHLAAVTTKAMLGTLEGSAAVYYAIGLALLVPSCWLVWQTRKVLASRGEHGRKTLLLNGWVAATLLVLGLHNLPLAAPAFANIGYQLSRRPALRWLFAGLAVLVTVGLFIGSLIFLASGQTFEQFRGIG